MNNLVAKHAHKFNRAAVMVDRKKESKSQPLTDRVWDCLEAEDKEFLFEMFEIGDMDFIHAYCKRVLNWSSGQTYILINDLRRGV